MNINLRIIENRVGVVSALRKNEIRSGFGSSTVRKWRRQRRVTSHGTCTLDGLSVKIDNLTLGEQMVLYGELSLIEAFLPELLTLLVNFQEEEE